MLSQLTTDCACFVDPLNCLAITRFGPVKRQSLCLFAKAAKLWGARDPATDQTSLEDYVRSSVPMLLQMLMRGEAEGFDGFIFEIRNSMCVGDISADVHAFAAAVRRVLVSISLMDPTGEKSALKPYIADKAWHFVFARFPIFVTTFAPCYNASSSRFTYDADENSGFILLQPEYSFLTHHLPQDTPHTNWDKPVTIRDRYFDSHNALSPGNQ